MSFTKDIETIIQAEVERRVKDEIKNYAIKIIDHNGIEIDIIAEKHECEEVEITLDFEQHLRYNYDAKIIKSEVK